MNGSVLNLFSDRGILTAKDVTPWQTFSGKGMKFQLQSFDWDDCACVSHLDMRAFFGLMRMETVICTPYSKDLPLFSYDGMKLPGKQIVFLEQYDTQVAPVDLSTMDTVKAAYSDLKDKPMKPAWYDNLKLSPTVYKTGRGPRFMSLAKEMTTAYINLFPIARDVDPAVKTARNSAYVEGLISNGGPAINTVRDILGNAAAETLFRRFLFGTER